MKAVAELLRDKIIIEDSKAAQSIHSKGSTGSFIKNKLELSFTEALYLLRRDKITLLSNNKEADEKELVKRAVKLDKRFNLHYTVYEDLRIKGYTVKTALKYGFDYRVYEKGAAPGKKHAKWLVACYNENERLYWKDFSRLIRVSHSVKKSAVTAIVDDEGDVTYWESNWKKL